MRLAVLLAMMHLAILLSPCVLPCGLPCLTRRNLRGEREWRSASLRRGVRGRHVDVKGRSDDADCRAATITRAWCCNAWPPRTQEVPAAAGVNSTAGAGASTAAAGASTPGSRLLRRPADEWP